MPRVRSLLPLPFGPVVQLVRTLACHARGRRFEPVPGRHLPRDGIPISWVPSGLKFPGHAVWRVKRFAQIAQLVEQWTENPRVAGSIPALGTTCGHSSSGRAPPCQGGGSEFEPRCPLQMMPTRKCGHQNLKINVDFLKKAAYNINVPDGDIAKW